MSADVEEVAADGSPVPVFLALPVDEAPRLIHDAVRPVGGTILELGCGAGRMTRPLVAFGHRLVAVDDSPAMLAHVTGAETVCADLYDLDLGRAFDGVVAGSYLVNRSGRDRRRALLRVCRRHVAPGGVVLVQRHDPEWAAGPADSDGTSGPVAISFRVLDRDDRGFRATVTYRLGARSWPLTFSAEVVDDDTLAEDADACGLVLERSLNEAGTWVLLRPTGARPPHIVSRDRP